MSILTTKPASPLLITINILLVALVLVLEKFAVGSHVYLSVKNAQGSLLADLLFENGKAISRSLVLAAAILLILCQKQLSRYRKLYSTYYSTQSFYVLISQIGVFAIFYCLTDYAFGASEYQVYFQIAWLIAGLLLGVLTLASIASGSFWKLVLAEQKWAMLIALVLSAAVWWLGITTQGLWTHFADFTFYLVAACLSWFSSDVFVDPSHRIIGFRDFLVNIDTQCSGYEGIGLVTAFVAVFLYSFRSDFRFPRALLLFPVGAVVIWLFNVVRIVVLIMIGSLWSPDVAVWGFHTQAGWIAFIMTSVGLMWLAHHSSFFVKQKSQLPSSTDTMNPAIATLIPLIALLAMTFITQALTGQFDWLYPLRVIVVGAVVVYCFKHLDLMPIKYGYFPVLVGFSVAVMWILMVKPDMEVDQLHNEALGQSSEWVAFAWLVFRFLGSAVTVPIAEELGFRSYLLCRVASQPITNKGSIPFSAAGFVISSLAFGLLHGAWIEGTLAGFAYAWVRYRSSHIMDAIIAHGITNAVLFGFVLYTGHWSVL